MLFYWGRYEACLIIFTGKNAEKFGANLRTTGAISIPNLVRSFLPLIIILFKFLRRDVVFNNYITAAGVTGAIVLLMGFISVLNTKETFGMDMDFTEE